LGAGNSAETKMPKELHTTNYRDTFISVAEDCSATSGEVPPERSGKATIAGLHYAMIKNKPYRYTSDDVVFSTSAAARAVSSQADSAEQLKARKDFFSKGQPCLRASALGKTFGWGVHSDSQGRVAMYSVDSLEYEKLATDKRLKQIKAMRSKKA
jgi:hypothetical protein